MASLCPSKTKGRYATTPPQLRCINVTSIQVKAGDTNESESVESMVKPSEEVVESD